MRLKLPEAQLQAAIERALLGSPPTSRPSADDLIELYLFLPTTITVSTGELKVRSSLEALLSDANGVTGRDDGGNVVDEDHLGTWLGAMGFLALIDQLGKALRWADRTYVGPTPFERILLQHGLSNDDAAALYSLRNAMVHSYGLANENVSRPELQRFFRLDVWGGSPTVVHPLKQWGGDPNDVQDRETQVSLQAVGDLAGNLVLHLQESWVTRRNLELAPLLTPEKMRRGYFFVHHP